MATTHDPSEQWPTALSIGGSDPSGGAGIQADLKTFSAHGVYGMTALTVATVGNTAGVRRALPLDAADVAAQIEAVCADIPVGATKTGMLANQETITAVAEAVKAHGLRPLVVDPVMTTRRGDPLLEPDAEHALLQLLPLATVVTPNLPEAERMSGMRIHTRADMLRAGERILQLGAARVVVKGGHLEAQDVATDLYLEAERAIWMEHARIPTVHTHGAGCTLSAAIAAGLARGWEVGSAVMEAKGYVAGAILHAPGLGHGRGPLHHGWRGAVHAHGGTAELLGSRISFAVEARGDSAAALSPAREVRDA